MIKFLLQGLLLLGHFAAAGICLWLLLDGDWINAAGLGVVSILLFRCFEDITEHE